MLLGVQAVVGVHLPPAETPRELQIGRASAALRALHRAGVLRSLGEPVGEAKAAGGGA